LTQKGEYYGVNKMRRKAKHPRKKLSMIELKTILGLALLILAGLAIIYKVEAPEVWYFLRVAFVALFGYWVSIDHKQ